jgi:predicted PilT family ATPase
MYKKEMSGQWYEKIKDKEVLIKSQSKLDSIPEEFIDDAIQNPESWIEVKDFKSKVIKNKNLWR